MTNLTQPYANHNQNNICFEQRAEVEVNEKRENFTEVRIYRKIDLSTTGLRTNEPKVQLIRGIDLHNYSRR
jgi:hypothetical protein